MHGGHILWQVYLDMLGTYSVNGIMKRLQMVDISSARCIYLNTLGTYSVNGIHHVKATNVGHILWQVFACRVHIL